MNRLFPTHYITDLWRTRAAVSLSLGAGSVRTIKLVRNNGDYTVAASSVVEYPSDREPHPAEIEDALLKAGREMIDEKNRVVTNLRTRDAGLHFMELPFDRPEKNRRVLKYTAEPHFLTPVDQLLLDYLPLPPLNQNDRPAAVFGAPLDSVALVMEQLGIAGLDPQILLPDRLGLMVAGRRLFQADDENRVHLLVDLGAGQTGLALFERDRPVIVRSVYYGGHDLTRRLAEAAELDRIEAEALKRETDLSRDDTEAARILGQAWQPLVIEIERTLAGILAERLDIRPIVVLAGGGAMTPGLSPFLSTSLDVDVMDASECASPVSGLTSDMVTPFGLALLALEPGYQPNLRQGEFAPLQILTRFKTPLLLMAAGILLVAMLNIGGLIHAYRLQSREYQNVRAERDRIFRQILPGAPLQSPVAQMRQKIEEIGGRSTGVGQDRVLDILLEVSRVTGAHQDVRVTDLSMNSQNMEMAGEGKSYEDIDLLKNELAALPFFSEANLRGARMDPNTRVLNFRISMRRNTG
jgi:Tfp pilus assembly PilM family ATPase